MIISDRISFFVIVFLEYLYLNPQTTQNKAIIRGMMATRNVIIIIFLKKFCLIALSSIKNLIGADMKCFLFILIQTVNLDWIITKKPFKIKTCNDIDALSSLVCIITSLILVLINFQKSSDLYETLKSRLGPLGFAINTAFTLFVIAYIVKNKIVEKIRASRKKVSDKMIRIENK